MSDTQFTLVQFTGFLPLLFGVFFLIQLYALKNYKVKSNRILSFFFGLLSFIVVFFLFNDLELSFVSQKLLAVLPAVVLALGPTVWIYIQSLVHPKRIYFKNIYNHYLPSFGVLFLNLVLFLLIFSSAKNTPIRDISSTILTYTTLGSITVCFLIQNVFYIYKSWRLFELHWTRIKNVFSYEEDVSLNWVRLFLIGYVFFIVGLVFSNLIENDISDLFFYLLLLVYIVFVGYFGGRQVDIYLGVKEEALTPFVTNEKEAIPTQKYATSSLINEGEILRIKDELLDGMEQGEYFLNPDLTIFALAESLKTNSKYLSQVINQEFKMNFISFVNQYRMQKVKTQLLSPEFNHYTIEGIAQKCGFKSKSSFNNLFKKATGLTPSQFKKQRLEAA